MDNVTSQLRRPTLILKLVELLLAIICAAIVGNGAVSFLSLSKTYTVSVAIHGFIIINLICIASYFMKTYLHQFIMLGIACLGAVMYFAAGGIMLEAYGSKYNVLTVWDYLLGSGIVALINGCVYLVDAFFSFKETTSSS